MKDNLIADTEHEVDVEVLLDQMCSRSIQKDAIVKITTSNASESKIKT